MGLSYWALLLLLLGSTNVPVATHAYSIIKCLSEVHSTTYFWTAITDSAEALDAVCHGKMTKVNNIIAPEHPLPNDRTQLTARFSELLLAIK